LHLENVLFRSDAATSEIGEVLGISRQGADRRLRSLRDAGDVASKKIGASLVWFTPRDRRRRKSDEPAVEKDAVDDAGETTPNDTNAESGRTRAESDAVDVEDAEAHDTVDAPLEDVDFPAGREREECSTAVYAARDYLREHGPATMREIVAEVLPEHPLGYDVDSGLEKVEAGDRYRGAWWRRVVKPGLKALPDVEAPAQGASNWRYTGDGEADTEAEIYDPTEEF